MTKLLYTGDCETQKNRSLRNEEFYERRRILQFCEALCGCDADAPDPVGCANHNLYGKSDSRPIHYIQNRIKKKKSLEEKLIRRGKEPTVDNAKDYLQDIAGVRIICYFVDDIYNLAKSLKRQADLIVIREQDYIKAPKPNGYRSYHLIVGVPVYCMDGMEYFPVEVQLRTLSMDFWASMEHRISYKKERADKEELTTELLGYANQLQEIEKSFESHNEIGKLKEPEKMEKDMAKPENTDSPIIS